MLGAKMSRSEGKFPVNDIQRIRSDQRHERVAPLESFARIFAEKFANTDEQLVDARHTDRAGDLLFVKELDLTSAPTIVPRWDEWHRGQDCLAQLVPDIHFDGGALLVPPALDIRHRDVLSQRRRGNAGRDGT